MSGALPPAVLSSDLLPASQVVQTSPVRQAKNGVCFAFFGDHQLQEQEVLRALEAVPPAIAAALSHNAYYFVPLTLASEGESIPDLAAASASRKDGRRDEVPLIAPFASPELTDRAICHRNLSYGGSECVFISTRIMQDRFALAFEFFINVGHAFVDHAGVPAEFSSLVQTQVTADVRGETSQDAYETRRKAAGPPGSKQRVDEKAHNDFLSVAFSDAIAIYLLSLTLDFDYYELREREYPLLAPRALADRLRRVNEIFPANPGYEFAIRFRRRS